MTLQTVFGIKKWAAKAAEDVVEELKLEIPKVEKPHDILVEIKAVATNPVDVKKIKNFGASDAEFKAERVIAGWDAAGVVKEVGSEVSLFKPGDEVWFAGSIIRDGCFAEFVLVDERIAAKKPSKLDWSQSAALPLCFLTAWEGLVEGLKLKVPTTPEEEKENQSKGILVTAGAGGVGSIAIQIAKKVLKFGTVVSTASRPESAEYAKKMGADYNVTHAEPLAPQLKKLGVKINHVYHCSDLSPETFADFVELLEPLGGIVTITSNHKPLDVSLLYSKRISLVAELMFTRPIYGYDLVKQHEVLSTAAALVDKGVIESTENVKLAFTLAGLKEALKIQESGRAIGKITLKK